MPLPDTASCRRRGTPPRAATFIVAGLAVAALLTADLGGQAVRETPFDAYLSRMREQGLVPDRNETLSQSYRGSLRDNETYQKLPAIQVFDNLFYVGPGFVSVWLIPTSDGLILVDTAQEPYVDHVIENVRRAGFDPEDIRYILIAHGHLDHYGGAGKIQALSGARIAALEEDWQMIEDDRRERSGNPNRPLGMPFDRDMVLQDGQTLTLGDTSLTIHHLPGHTAGSPSFEFTVYDGGTPHDAFLFGGPGQRGTGEDFLASLNRIMANMQDVEVAVHVHSWLSTFPYPGGSVFERALRLSYRQPGDPHPFADNVAWRIWLERAHAGAVNYVREQGR
jgi:metallo-beta-lactamase class B